jgi:hypothetical protein
MLNTAKVSINFLALNEMKKVSHLSDSLDLAPSNFFLQDIGKEI